MISGFGLMLRIQNSGAESWAQRIVIHGKRRDIGLGTDRSSRALSWAASLSSTSVYRARAASHRASSSAVTRPLAGSLASYCRKARSAA